MLEVVLGYRHLHLLIEHLPLTFGDHGFVLSAVALADAMRLQTENI